MIDDVDELLRALVRKEALNGASVEVAFEAPTKEWVARRNAPTVDLYLYDIREDLMRREVSWEGVRDDAGIIRQRRPPPRRFRLSYLVTAWTQRPEDEHRLLASLLGCFLRHQTIPAADLPGSLADQPLPIYTTIALPPGQDRSIADVWTALGGELKPSLDLVVIAPVPLRMLETAGPPVTEGTRLAAGGEQKKGRGAAEGAAAAAAPKDEFEEVFSSPDRKGGRVLRVRTIRRRA